MCFCVHLRHICIKKRCMRLCKTSNRNAIKWGWRTTAYFTLFTLLLSGCWDRKETNELSMILAVGFDQLVDGTKEVSILCFVPGAGGGESGGQSGSSSGGRQGNIYRYTVIGRTATEAYSSIQQKITRRLFWAETKIVLFGETLAKAGISDELDFLFRNVETREQMKLFLSERTAKEKIYELSDPNVVSLLISFARDAKYRSYTLVEVMQGISGESKAFFLPYLDTRKINVNLKQTGIWQEADKIAVISQRKLAGSLEKKLAKGNLWLSPNLLRRIVGFPFGKDGQLVTLEILSHKFRLSPQVSGNKWSMEVRIDVEADVYQNTSNVNFFAPEDNLRKLEGPFNKEIQKEVESVIEYLQTEARADAIGFGHAFHCWYPSIWKREKANWNERFPSVETKVVVNSKIRRAGLSSLIKLTDPKK
ncbi:Ger(x)C family spore germination protein [Paenibacillus tyrfis]|uniref:Ger(x)C family spore germination protein n=1 Tax=Paenibacillus tyrfis TaxID=1501230 RepID=UPI000B590EC5|nr:Ger(x)C family spore germination protein [Paenibacillus tyrfis]